MKIIIYDFDGTLTPYPIPRFEMLEKCGIVNEEINNFYLKVYKKAQEENIDLYLALYQTYFEIIEKSGFKLTNDNLCLGCDSVKYNKGVEEFLNNLHSNNVKNYLLSSGLKVYLERTIIAHLFEGIYATTFNYDENDEVVNIDYLVSDKNKVEAIKQILKENGIENDDCSNVIYIGDGLTDLYAMEYVKKNNGETIFVYYGEESKEMKSIKDKDVVSLFAEADFSSDGKISQYINELCNIDFYKSTSCTLPHNIL